MNDAVLPEPGRTRWQPLRAGLVDIFYYDQEEFPFRDGRLLLRGNNGTGKSKVLALTLPFLLDGQITPARVEPDGDPGKRMDWNLLLGNRYDERLGYIWLEFGRLDEAGMAHFLTIGCGLKAVHKRPLRTWFFVTPQRIGQDFWLVDQNRYALSRERLQEALTGRGIVYDSATRYRSAVDEHLFQLGAERYDALINLLIQLRQPQLSKRPNEAALSAALSNALSPLEQAVLRDVAEAFRNLDDEREELDGLKEARQAVEQFQQHYQAYARIAARRRAREVRQSHSQCDILGSKVKQTRAEQEAALQRRRALDEELQQMEGQLDAQRVAERTLRDSPEMRSAQALRQVEKALTEKAASADKAQRRERQAETDLQAVQQKVQTQQAATSGSREDVITLVAEARQFAEQAACAEQHQEILQTLALPDGMPTSDASGRRSSWTQAKQHCAELGERRQRDVLHLQKSNRELEKTQDRIQHAREELQHRRDHAESLAEERGQAEQGVQRGGEQYIAAATNYLETCRELPLAGTAAVIAELADWVASMADDNPLRLALENAYRDGLQQLTRQRAAIEQQRALLEQRRQQLQTEYQALQAGEIAAPPIPYSRSENARSGRSGAPLWQLIDFRDELSAGERAGLEAALEACGLLDAWLLPDGSLLDAETWDVVLRTRTPQTSNLNQVLQVAVDRADPQAAALSDEDVQAVLAGIGLDGDGDCQVTLDGRWRLAALDGVWHKEAACYIGRGARETARRKRLAELDALLAAVADELAAIDAGLSELASRVEQLNAEVQAAPDEAELRQAHQRVAELNLQYQHALTEQERAAGRLTASERQWREQSEQRDQLADDLNLPVAPEALEQIAQGLVEYRNSLSALWPNIDLHWGNLSQLVNLQADQQQAGQRLSDCAEEALLSEDALRAAQAERDTLAATVGTAAREVEQRLADTEKRIQELDATIRRARTELTEVAGRVGELNRQIQNEEDTLEEERQRRQDSILNLQSFTRSGLLTSALPELSLPLRQDEWPVEIGVRLARTIEQELQQTDDGEAALNRYQKSFYAHFMSLQSALSRHGLEASVEESDSGLLVRISFQGRPCRPDELSRRLQEEIGERQALLSARERELLETHLINEVASQLQEMIRLAETQVQRMNQELESRPTSTGMKLRLRWLPLEDEHGAPAGLVEARRRLLRQTSDAWSVEDREAVGRFLQQHIDSVRAVDEGGTLLEHLEQALDYRRWHHFTVQRWQDGQWRKGTGPASGGERVLAMTVPLFAAASAHYGSADPRAPRMIMLDEAFAGVDDDSRAKCMGLLAQFDLDFVMTSEREWGCYAELPGLAIAQLARREGIDAVFVTRWTWDGKRRERDYAEPNTAFATQPAEPTSGELFAE